VGSDLQQNRYDQLIRRVGGIIGPGSKVAEALAELFPVIDVENVPGELLILGQTALCIGSTSIVAAPGEFPVVQLFNPTGSGNIIAVDRIDIGTTSTQTLAFGMNNAQEPGAGFKQFLDARKGLFPLPIGEIGADSNVAAQVGVGRWAVTGSVPFSVQPPRTAAVLSPGTGVNIGGFAATTSLFVTFWWRERVGEASELNL